MPGEGGDFGDGVQVEGGREGHVVMMDDVPMPSLDSSDSMRLNLTPVYIHIFMVLHLWS